MPIFREDLLGWLDQCVKPQSRTMYPITYTRGGGGGGGAYYLQNLQGDLCELNNN